MKRFVVFLIAVTVRCMSIFAYEYLPSVKEGCVWELGREFNEDGTPYISYILWFEGDTVLNGYTYKKLHVRFNQLSGTDHGIVGCMREEDKRVYNFTKLIYDFNYHKGDTIPPLNKYIVASIVTDEDTIEVNGISRRRLKFKYNTKLTQVSWYWVEGIGGSEGILPLDVLCNYYENGVPVFTIEDFYLPRNGVSWIEPVKATKPQNSGTDCYDLMGRRIVGTPSRGIYLKGGRKYLVK